MPELQHLEGGSEGVAVSFKDKIKSKVSSLMTVSNLIIVAVAIILLIIGYFIYKRMKSSPQSTYNVNNEVEGSNTEKGSKEAEIMMFTVNWCPHCKTAKPEWDKIKAEYDNKDVNGYTIVFTDVDCTEETPETTQLMNTYKIEGYPTIKLLKDGEIIEYDAKPQYDTLKEFLNKVL